MTVSVLVKTGCHLNLCQLCQDCAKAVCRRGLGGSWPQLIYSPDYSQDGMKGMVSVD